MLARFAQAIKPEPRELPDAEKQAFSALLAQRRHTVTCITAEKNRLGQAHAYIQASIKRTLAALQKELDSLDADLSGAARTKPWGNRDFPSRRGVEGGARC